MYGFKDRDLHVHGKGDALYLVISVYLTPFTWLADGKATLTSLARLQ